MQELNTILTGTKEILIFLCNEKARIARALFHFHGPR